MWEVELPTETLWDQKRARQWYCVKDSSKSRKGYIRFAPGWLYISLGLIPLHVMNPCLLLLKLFGSRRNQFQQQMGIENVFGFQEQYDHKAETLKDLTQISFRIMEWIEVRNEDAKTAAWICRDAGKFLGSFEFDAAGLDLANLLVSIFQAGESKWYQTLWWLSDWSFFHESQWLMHW